MKENRKEHSDNKVTAGFDKEVIYEQKQVLIPVFFDFLFMISCVKLYD